MNNIIWPKILVRSLVHGNLNILFGAGLGIEFGFPMWGKLIEKIYFEIKHKFEECEHKEFQGFIDSHDYLEAMEFLMDRDSEQVLDSMERLFRKPEEEYDIDLLKTSNLQAILSLGAHSILTTNVDNSIEYVKGYTGHKSSPLYSYHQEEDIKDKLILHDSLKNPLFIRLHGTLDTKSSLIFSKTQYSKLLQSHSYIFEQVLPAILLTSANLIVGYSMSDPDIQLVFENIHSIKGNRSNIFFLNADPTVSEFKKKKFKERYGITTIDIFSKTEQNDELSFSERITRDLRSALQDLLNLKSNLSNKDVGEITSLFKESDKTILDILRKENHGTSKN